MVFFLILNVGADTLNPGGTDRKRPIPALPGKCGPSGFFMIPRGRDFFDFPNNIRERVGGLKPEEQMDMIGNAADFDRVTPFVFQSTAEDRVHGVKRILIVEPGFAILGTEHNVGF